MRLESALYSSSTSLQAHGKALQIIGDNISNVNTIAHKSSSVQFGDLVAEGSDGHNSTADPVAGNGVSADNILQNYSLGTTDLTNRALDVAIAGDGFYTVGDVSNQQFTRAGTFIIDGVGDLALSTGEKVLGYTGAAGTSLGTIDMVNLDVSGTPTSSMAVSGNLDGRSASRTDLPVDPIDFQTINSNADLFTGTTVFDSLGEGHPVTLAFFKTALNTWTVRGYMDGSELTGGTAGVPVQVGTDTTLSFGGNGLIADEDQAAAVMTITTPYGNGSEPGSFTIDFAGFSQYATTSVLNSIVQDGQGTGSIDDYQFREDGSIIATLTGGTEIVVGTLPVATFNNNEGLNRSGSGLYGVTEASGDAVQNTAGTNGAGALQGGAVELSNVDLSTQFVNLVVYQRGYQAGSQIFSQTNTMLRDTINLIR